MTDHVETMLAQFSRAFTVRDIMTPCVALEGAANPDEARAKSEANNYDVIIHPASGVTPTGYFYQGGGLQPILADNLVSDGTNLFDFLNLLEEQKLEGRGFFFVLTSNKISGFVHFSDLNKSVMKTAFYVMIEAAERHLLGVLRMTLANDQELENALTSDSKKRVQGLLKKAKEKRSDPSLWDVLGWPHVLEVARFQGLVHKSQTELMTLGEQSLLKDFRDRVAHTGLLLVESYDEVHSLIEVRHLCSALREWNKVPAS